MRIRINRIEIPIIDLKINEVFSQAADRRMLYINATFLENPDFNMFNNYWSIGPAEIEIIDDTNDTIYTLIDAFIDTLYRDPYDSVYNPYKYEIRMHSASMTAEAIDIKDCFIE